MKNSKYLLKIENSCHEKWDEMSPTDQGKFCSHCAKNVTDFSKMTDAQIIQFIDQSNGSFCGRLTQTQMNRIVEMKEPTKTPNYAAVIAGVLAIGASNTAVASSPIDKQVEIVSRIDTKSDMLQIHADGDTIRKYIEGNVKDLETNEELYGVKIMVKDHQIGTLSDLDGNFKMNLPDSLSGKKITLVISTPEYDSLEIEVTDRAEFQKLYLTTSIELIQMIGAVVVDKHPGKTKRRMKREERKNKSE